MATVSGYELSSEYLRGFARSAEKQGALEHVPWSPVMAKMLGELDSGPWWPPEELEQWGVRLLELRGDAAIEGIGYHLSIKSIAPILRVTTKLSGGAAPAVLKQFTVLVSDSIRGVAVRFDSSAPGSGTFVVRYPTRNPPHANALLWKGTLKRVAETIPNTTLGTVHEDEATFRFGFSWTR